MTTVQSNMTRRDFLKFTAKTAVISSGFLAGCSALSSPKPASVSAIDIHHHYIPLELIEEVKAHGKAKVAVARHLAEACFWMLKKGEPYREPMPSTQR